MEDEEWLRLGVAAALAREYAADQRQFLEHVAGLLEGALPGHARITRRGLPPFTRRVVREISVTLGDHAYELSASGAGPLLARRVLTKRGIVLSTQDMLVPAWITELCGRLEELARHNQAAAEALRRLV